MEGQLVPSAPGDGTAKRLIRAAQYIRKSTDHQRYSTENQSDANHAYAEPRGIQIVRTYIDDGISGLTFERRDALQRLIDDVLSGDIDFEAILVLDVSRWGRFQDVDEGAYYEYLCKRAGMAVHYCAEPFENDGSLISTVVKSLKRAMAGEYSRELSVKVFAGQKRVMSLGFRLGGIAGYGYRRLLVDGNRTAKGILAPGEWKSISTDRILLVPGPTSEIETVNFVYSTFVRDGKSEYDIADILNERGIPNHLGNRWRAGTVRHMLRCEKYIGNHVWNRKSTKLRSKTVRNAPDRWVRVDGVFEPIVERSMFDAAQKIFSGRVHRTQRGRPRGLSDEEMILRLACLYREHGSLSRRIIDTSEDMPSCWSYRVRFGSVARAYELVGFKKNANQYGPGIRDRLIHKDPRGLRDEEMIDALGRLLREKGYLSTRVINECKDVPSSHAYQTHFGGLPQAYALVGYTRPYRTRPSLSNEEMLRVLGRLGEARGDLSRRIINSAGDLPSAATYADRFGGLLRAYRLIGFKPHRFKLFTTARGMTNEAMLQRLAQLLKDRGYLNQKLINGTEGMPSRSTYYNRFGSLRRAYELIGYTPEDRRSRVQK
jgi:DNA invertase Pin-like site-specific DNA recombinase